jgi:PAS domain S-box-containing protein
MRKNSANKKANAKRKPREERLKFSEQQYRVTLDAMDDAIYVIDNKFTIILANKAIRKWHRRFGITQNVVGKNMFEVYPFLLPKIKKDYNKVFKTAKPLLTEEFNVVKGFNQFTETRKIPVIENNRVVRVVTVVRDITERKESESTLIENERFLKGVFDGMRDGVSILDKDFNIIRTNVWMKKMYASEKPLAGKKCYKTYQQRNKLISYVLGAQV